MFERSVGLLETGARRIDSINVFPVPDGDTGTNMLLTLRAAVAFAARELGLLGSDSAEIPASTVVDALAAGAMDGARGNSGLLVSQLFVGIASVLKGRRYMQGRDLARGLARAAVLARHAVSEPVEGTILTVLDDVARAVASSTESPRAALSRVLEAAADAARASVERTPSLLPVLRESGVVDAGALGLYTVLEGLRGTQTSGAVDPAWDRSRPRRGESGSSHHGYCTECLLTGKDLDEPAIRKHLAALGDSVVVAGDDSRLRAHLHTSAPEAVRDYLGGLGTLHDFRTENMDAQVHALHSAARRDSATGTEVIVIATELRTVLRGLGGQVVADARQAEAAAASSPTDRIIVVGDLTGDEARSICASSGKEIALVATKHPAQQAGALIGFTYDRDLAAAAREMQVAADAVRSVEIRESESGGGLRASVDGRPVAPDGDPARAIRVALLEARVGSASAITFYRRDGSPVADAVLEQLRTLVSGVSPEIVPVFEAGADVIVSVE